MTTRGFRPWRFNRCRRRAAWHEPWQPQTFFAWGVPFPVVAFQNPPDKTPLFVQRITPGLGLWLESFSVMTAAGQTFAGSANIYPHDTYWWLLGAAAAAVTEGYVWIWSHNHNARWSNGMPFLGMLTKVPPRPA